MEVQQSGAVVPGKQPEVLSLPFSKNWASHSALKACAKEAKEIYNAEDLKHTTPTAFETDKTQQRVCCNSKFAICFAGPSQPLLKDKAMLRWDFPSHLEIIFGSNS